MSRYADLALYAFGIGMGVIFGMWISGAIGMAVYFAALAALIGANAVHTVIHNRDHRRFMAELDAHTERMERAFEAKAVLTNEGRP